MTNNKNFNNSKDTSSLYMPGYGDYLDNMYSVVTNNLDPTSYDYDTSKEAERDNAYILFLFPEEARQIKELVQEALNRLDYEGSVIYSEYPDKVDLQNILNRIYQHLNENMMQDDNMPTPPNNMPSNTMPTPTMAEPSNNKPSSPITSAPPLTAPSNNIDAAPITNPSNTTPSTSETISTMQYPYSRPTPPPCREYNCKPPYYPPTRVPDGRPNWLRQLLESLFYDEMINRRRKHFNNIYR